MRNACPVPHSDYLGRSVFKHTDVMSALTDPEHFSNVASTWHVAVPNGMDHRDHTEYRRAIDTYFVPERMQSFEPACRGSFRVSSHSATSPRLVRVSSHTELSYLFECHCRVG
jgi:cytochrome P450